MPPQKKDLPRTLKRSPEKAQRTWLETLENALETYDGNEQRAYRTAWAAVKHSYEKVGDRWQPKAEKGPSDPRAAGGGADPGGESFGGLDYFGHTKQELLERARELGVEGRSRMSKIELARAIAKKQ